MIKKAFGALKEEFGLKKVIAILILLASMGFLLTQNDGLKYSSNYFNNEHISQITHREYLPYKRNDEKMQKVKDAYTAEEVKTILNDMIEYSIDAITPLAAYSQKGSLVSSIGHKAAAMDSTSCSFGLSPSPSKRRKSRAE